MSAATAEMSRNPNLDQDFDSPKYDPETDRLILDDEGMDAGTIDFVVKHLNTINELIEKGDEDSITIAKAVYDSLDGEVANNRDHFTKQQLETIEGSMSGILGDKILEFAPLDADDDENKITRDRPFPPHKKNARAAEKSSKAGIPKDQWASNAHQNLAQNNPVDNYVNLPPKDAETSGDEEVDPAVEAIRQQVIAEQDERRASIQADIDRYIEAGVPDEQMDAFINDVGRMEKFELLRGGLMKIGNFLRLEPFLADMRSQLEPGLGLGYEQGQYVSVRRTSKDGRTPGKVEGDWIFAGVVADSDRIRVAKLENEDEGYSTKDILLSDLDSLNRPVEDETEEEPENEPEEEEKPVIDAESKDITDVMKGQSARREVYQQLIDDYVAKGKTDPEMDAFINNMARMEEAERNRGSLFNTLQEFLDQESGKSNEKKSIKSRLKDRWTKLKGAALDRKIGDAFDAVFGNEKGEKSKRNALIAALAGATAVSMYVILSRRGMDASSLIDGSTPPPVPKNSNVADAVDLPGFVPASPEVTPDPSAFGIDLASDMPWEVANKVSPGNETSAIQNAMTEYATKLGTEVKFTGTGTSTMIQVGDHIATPDDVAKLNELIFNKLT